MKHASTLFLDSRYCWCPFQLRSATKNIFLCGPDREVQDFHKYINCRRHFSSSIRRGQAKLLSRLDTIAGFRPGGESYYSVIKMDPATIMPIEVLHTILLGLVKYMAYELFRQVLFESTFPFNHCFKIILTSFLILIGSQVMEKLQGPNLTRRGTFEI